MARSIPALVEPALLVWARQSVDLDIAAAAKKADVTEERLEAWERGESRPSIAQLRKLGKVYKRPIAIFYLPEPPRDYQPVRDYRRLPDAEVGKLSPELHAAIRRAHLVREAALELLELEDEQPSAAPAAAAQRDDPERFGVAMRDLLGVTLETQRSWMDPRRALNAWIDAVSQQGVLVLQQQAIPLDEMRALSIWMEPLPIIVLNGGDFPRGRIFSLLHELAHVLLHASGVCDTLPRRRIQRPTDQVELFCNAAAAATLMPEDAFLAAARVAGRPEGGRWPADALEVLSAQFSVSEEAVVRRLHTFELASWAFLLEKQAEYRAIYEANREEQRRRREEGAGGPTFYRMKVRDLGRGFIESALDAYNRRAITGSDLSEYLEIKINQIPKLEAELAATGSARD